MPIEPTLVVDVDDHVAHASRRALPRPIAYACALVVATAAVVLLGTTQAAAADELGGVVADTVETVEMTIEPAVDPASEGDAVAPIVEALEPMTGELPPIDPVEPIHPIAPIVDRLIPAIEPLVPSVGATPLPATIPALREPALAADDAAGELASAPLPEAELAATHADDLEASAGIHGTAPIPAAGNAPFELPIPLHSPLADGGTTLVAALLIGILMAAPAGWTAAALATQLRPLGLAVGPPVPPG